MAYFRPQSDVTSEITSMIELIKRLLKERRMSYAQLGTELGLSESGVKKMLSGNDLSYARLSQIASVLGLKVLDLLAEVETQESRSLVFSAEEQDYFLENPESFHFFVRLLIERKPLEEIRSELRMTEAATFRILKKLDQFGWIELQTNNKVKLPPLSLVRDFGAGPLLNFIYQKWSHATVQDLAKPEFQKTGQFIVRCVRMKNSTYQEFLRQLQELEMWTLRTAIREMNVSNKDLKTFRWISLTDQKSFLDN